MGVQEMEDRPTLGRRLGGNAALVVAQETLQEIQYQRQTMTDMAAMLSGRMTNKVLQVQTYVFPAEGYVMLEWGAAAGCIRVTPLGAADVTVTTAPATGAPPLSGLGVSVVRAANPDTVPLASTVCTLYGTPGQGVSVQVFAAPVTP